MAPRRYSFGFAGQNFNFDLPAIGEGENEQTRSVLASYFPELRLSYGAKTQRGGRLGRDVTPVQTEVTMAPYREGGGATVNITGPTATQTITQAGPAAPAPMAPEVTQPVTPAAPSAPAASTPAAPAPAPTTPETPATPETTTPATTTPAAEALKQFTGNIGGVGYKAIGGQKFGGSDVQAAIKAGYDPGSLFGYAASLPKSELGKVVRQDLKAAGFSLSEKGAYGGTLPSAPTAAQTFLDKALAKDLKGKTEKEVSAVVARAQGIPVAAASATAQPTSIASPFTFVAPPKPVTTAPTFGQTLQAANASFKGRK